MNWLPYANFGLTIVVLAVSLGGFLKVMNNDLQHVQRDLKEIKDSQKSTDNKIDGLGERISKIEGTCLARKECK